MIRLIAYRKPPTDNLGQIARMHRDRGSITFALYESHSGLEFTKLTGEKGGREDEFENPTNWYGVSSLPDQPKVFTGLKGEELLQIPASWHRVMKRDDQPQGILRLSVVFFFHIPGAEVTKPTH